MFYFGGCDSKIYCMGVRVFFYYQRLLTFSLGFAAGAMFYVSFFELIPEIWSVTQKTKSNPGMSAMIFGASAAFVYVISD